jgi:SAM-dependent methyltransferase
MGLSKPALRFIAREHCRKPFGGPVLTLGKQNIFATLGDIDKILRSEKIVPSALPPTLSIGNNIPAWAGTPYEKFTNDRVFFAALGLADVSAMDFYDFEGAEIIADLNRPLPSDLHDKFDFILDSGTTEHVFDVRQSFGNIVRMLKKGGRILHILPANNYVNHGFYQFSPTFFFDFYRENGFKDLRGFIVEESTRLQEYRPWNFYQINPKSQPAQVMSARRLAVAFLAEKTPLSTADKIPTQSFYVSMAQGDTGTEASTEIVKSGRSVHHFLKHALSPSAKRWFYRYLVFFDSRNVLPLFVRSFLMGIFFWINPARKPWGLKFWGRL